MCDPLLSDNVPGRKMVPSRLYNPIPVSSRSILRESIVADPMC